MFQRVCGFHIVFDKDQAHENVKKFSVKLLNLSRNNRHLDNQVHRPLSLHYMPPCAAVRQVSCQGKRGRERRETGGRKRIVCGDRGEKRCCTWRD
jgi:hypothetical protein